MQKARQIVMMANGNGWKEVEQFIEDNMKPLENRLFNENLEKEEFAVIQARRQTYKSVLDFVNRRIEIVVKENQGG